MKTTVSGLPVKLTSAPPSLTAIDECSRSQDTQIQPAKKLRQGVFGVFGSTFLTIFLSEMGDKTQLATLLMSAESQSPWVVFAGAGSALVTTSLLGCLVGRWLANRISPRMLKTSAGFSLLFIAVQLLWEVLHS